jgi:hypothetical protein
MMSAHDMGEHEILAVPQLCERVSVGVADDVAVLPELHVRRQGRRQAAGRQLKRAPTAKVEA